MTSTTVSGNPMLEASSESRRFADVVYWLDDSINVQEKLELETLLDPQGARPVKRKRIDPTLSTIDNSSTDKDALDDRVDRSSDLSTASARFEIPECTHIITLSWNLIERGIIQRDPTQAERLGKSLWIVKPTWVRRSVVVGLQSPEYYSADPTMIFSGIIINCSPVDFPEGDIDAIYGAVQTFGGQHRRFATKEITHLICVSPTEAQFRAIVGSKLGIKVVLPEWVQECIKLRRLVPVHTFEFTSVDTPPAVRQAALRLDPHRPFVKHMDTILADRAGDGYLGADAEQQAVLWSAQDKTEMTFPRGDSHADPVREAGVFTGKKVLLGQELAINAQTKEALDQWIITAGGIALSDESDMTLCDIYITKWRDGEHYSQAVKLNKTVGTLLWFFFVLKVGRLTSPMDELLHYPVPREVIPGLKAYKIAVSNYTGDAREYIKKLIMALGGQWTNSLSKAENTHLIAANTHSDKVDRARVWGINVVNHFWLEDCFVKWENIGTGHPRYTDYPAGVNYMSSIGRAHLTEESLSRWIEAALAWGEEDEMGAVEQDMQLGGPTQPTPAASTKPRDQPPTQSGLQVDVESDKDRDATPKAAGPSRLTSRQSPTLPPEPTTKRKSKTKSPVIEDNPGAKEPKRRKVITPEPVTTSTGRARRQAATKAGDAVHQMAEDMNLFQKEKHRKDLIPPSERKAARISNRREADAETEHESDVDMDRDEEDENTRPAASKRKTAAKKRSASAKATTEEPSDVNDGEDIKPDISEHGCTIATTGVKLTAIQTKFLRKYGATLTEDPQRCTHLVADGLKRTPKLLLALSQAPFIVGPSWLDACKEAKTLVDPSDHSLSDTEGERKLGSKLSDVLDRAADVKAKGGLLYGQRFILTPALKPSKTLLTEIVDAHGGSIETKRPTENDGKTFVLSDPEDRASWKPYLDKGIPVYTKEYLLAGVFAMQLDPEAHKL